VTDAARKQKRLLKQDEVNAIKTAMFKRMRQRHNAIAAKQRKQGADFLAKHTGQQGVITTRSGLQYKVLRPGKGPTAKATDRVRVHYRGTLTDGTEFDSSYKRNRPAVFPVRGVIRGWTEALQLMNVGSKYKLFIPSDLAYGQRGSPPRIGPNQVLVFEVELLAIEKSPAQPGGRATVRPAK